MIDNVNLNGGIIIWDDFNIDLTNLSSNSELNFDSDLLMVNYKNRYVLTISWVTMPDIDGLFKVHVVEYCDFNNPLLQKEVYAQEATMLPNCINTAVRFIACLLKSSSFVNKDNFISKLQLLDGYIYLCNFDIDLQKTFDQQGEKYKAHLLSISFPESSYGLRIDWLPEYDPQGEFITTIAMNGDAVLTKKTCDTSILIEHINESIKMAHDLGEKHHKKR